MFHPDDHTDEKVPTTSTPTSASASHLEQTQTQSQSHIDHIEYKQSYPPRNFLSELTQQLRQHHTEHTHHPPTEEKHSHTHTHHLSEEKHPEQKHYHHHHHHHHHHPSESKHRESSDHHHHRNIIIEEKYLESESESESESEMGVKRDDTIDPRIMEITVEEEEGEPGVANLSAIPRVHAWNSIHHPHVITTPQAIISDPVDDMISSPPQHAARSVSPPQHDPHPIQPHDDPFDGITLSWTALHVWLAPRSATFRRGIALLRRILCLGEDDMTSQSRIILHPNDGEVKAGTLCAIMGSSGSGKTSLLNTLAGRALDASGAHVEGTLSLNHIPQSNNLWLHSISAYIMQHDVAMGAMTVKETMEFAAKMKLKEDDQQLRDSRITRLLDAFDLTRCADVRVGSQSVGSAGISGGQLKRLMMACALITEPKVIFLDECTSGLDSSNAYKIMSLLYQLTRERGCTVICTIHSPSTIIYQMFDRLILMAKGHMLYQGPASTALSYFDRLGYTCPPLTNPAEHLLQIAHFDTSKRERHRLVALSEAYLHHVAQQPAPAAPGVGAGAAQVVKSLKHPRSWGYQFMLLASRASITYRRQPMVLLIRIAQNVFLSLFVGLLFLHTQHNQQAIVSRIAFLFFMLSIQSFVTIVNSVLTFSEEITVLHREISNRMYATSAYFLGRTMLDMPVFTMLAVLFGVFGYYMVGLEPGASRFFSFILCLALISNACHSIGLILGAIAPHPLVAVMLCPLIMVPFMLTTGFFINLVSIPSFLIWLKILSPHRYMFSAIMINEMKDAVFMCKNDESFKAKIGGETYAYCPYTSGEQLVTYFSLQHDNFAFNMWITFILLIAFRFIAYLCLRQTMRITGASIFHGDIHIQPQPLQHEGPVHAPDVVLGHHSFERTIRPVAAGGSVSVQQYHSVIVRDGDPIT